MRASVFIATSVDGFIARRDGAIDWLHAQGSSGREEDHGYDAFIATVDALVMGRRTFEKVLTFGIWPYGSLPVFVLSSRSVTIPAELQGSVEALQGSPVEVWSILEHRGLRHLYVDGGVTIQAFLAAGLIHEIIITRIPVLIGDGIPLFGRLPDDLELEHVRTDSYPSGLVQSRYRVKRR